MTLNSSGERSNLGVSTAQPYSYRDSLTQLELIGEMRETISTWQDDIDAVQSSTSADLAATIAQVNTYLANMTKYVDATESRLMALIRRGVLTGLYNDPTDSSIDKPLNIVIERVYSFANTHALYAGQYSLPVSPTCGTLDSRQDTARTRDTGMTITINTDPSVFPALR